MFPGYAGRILFVDLSAGQFREEHLAPELIEKFLGGMGINNWLAWRHIPPLADALSPENAIIVGSGPFSGTIIPGSAELLITTKFPINGAFATAAGGGAFPMRLKSCGYDHLVIHGKAASPVYLLLGAEGPEIRDATSLWGKDGQDTVDDLNRLHESCSVIPIGPAGENRVALSVAFIDKTNTVGRGGLPAVMGAKNLKALVACQGKLGVRMASPRRLERLANALHERIMKWPGRAELMKEGLVTDGPTLNPVYVSEPSTPAGMKEEYYRLRERLACPSCPLGEKSRLCLPDGDFTGVRAYMMRYKVENFGGEGRVAHDRSLKFQDVLNRLGLDLMNFTHLFVYACRLYQEGTITGEHTDGMELKPDLETALRLAEATAYRRGLGAVFAQGLIATGIHFGDAALGQLDHVKGQAPIFDGRMSGLGTMEFSQVINPRGAHVAAGGSPSYLPGQPVSSFLRHGERMGAEPEAVARSIGENSFNPGIFTRFSDDWWALFNCLGMCNRAWLNRFYSINSFTEFYQALTGRDVEARELMKSARRAYDLGRFLNTRIGFGRRDDTPPPSWFRPLRVEGKEHHLADYHQNRVLSPEDFERFMDDYYRERGYDIDTGAPTAAMMEEMGIAPS